MVTLSLLVGCKGRTLTSLYLSHKAVHSDFVPHDRHRGRYEEKPFPAPPTLAAPEGNPGHWPRWVLDQRNSRHGVGYGYNLSDFDVALYYRRYMEALLAVDENVSRVLDWLEKEGAGALATANAAQLAACLRALPRSIRRWYWFARASRIMTSPRRCARAARR